MGNSKPRFELTERIGVLFVERRTERTSWLPLLVRGAVTPKGFIGVTERIFLRITVALLSAYLCPTIFLRVSVSGAILTPFLL